MRGSPRKGTMELTPETLRVRVIHYTRFVERRTHMEKVLAEHGLDRFEPCWILEHDREEVPELAAWVAGPGAEGGKRRIWGALNAGHVSVIRKHLAALRMAAEDSGAPWHLVLEDDVILEEDFLPKLGRMLAGLPEDWEIVFVGDGCKLHVPWWRRWLAPRAEREAGAYFRGWRARWWGGGGMSRCAAGYVVRPESARRFLSSGQAHPPFEAPIDWLMNLAGAELRFRSYWAEPPLVRQDVFGSWTRYPGLT